MPEFNHLTQFQGHPEWVGEGAKESYEKARNLSYQRKLKNFFPNQQTAFPDYDFEPGEDSEKLEYDLQLANNPLQGKGPTRGGLSFEKLFEVPENAQWKYKNAKGEVIPFGNLFEIAKKKGIVKSQREFHELLRILNTSSPENIAENFNNFIGSPGNTFSPYQKQKFESTLQGLSKVFDKAGVKAKEVVRGHTPYEGQRYEPLSQQERELMSDAERFKEGALSENTLDLYDQQAREARHNQLSEAVDPLLARATGPGSYDTIANRNDKRYQDMLSTLEERSNEKLKDQIAQDINPYLISHGLMTSGAKNEFYNKAFQKNQKELNHLRHELGYRMVKDVGDEADRERKLLLGGAELKGSHLSKDIAHRQQSAQNLSNAEQQRFKSRLIGHDVNQQTAQFKRNLAQQARDFSYLEAERQRAAPMENLQRLHNIALGMPNMVPTEQSWVQSQPNPNVNRPSIHSVLGANALAAAGAVGSAQAQPFKKGGYVDDDRYADGGYTPMPKSKNNYTSMPKSTNQDYSPLSSSENSSYLGPSSLTPSSINSSYLGPTKKSTASPQVMKKLHEYHPKIMPQVQNLFSGHDLEMNKPTPSDADLAMMNTPEMGAIRKRIGKLEKTESTPFWDMLMGAGQGMLKSGAKDTIGMLMGGGDQAVEAFKNSRKEASERADKIVDLNQMIQNTRQVQLDREMKYRHEKDKSITDRIKANAESMHNSADLGLRSRSLDEAIRHHKETEENSVLTKQKKLDQSDQNILDDAASILKNSPEMKRDLDELKELSKRIYSGKLTRNFGSFWSSFPGGQGNQSDLEQFDKKAADLVVKATRMFGSKAGARIAEMISKSKPSRQVSQEGNSKNIESMSEGNDRENERAHFIIEATEDYNITPKKAIQLYSEYEKNAKKDPDASPWKKIDPNHEFENKYLKSMKRLAEESPDTLKKMYEEGRLTEEDINIIADMIDKKNAEKDD